MTRDDSSVGSLRDEREIREALGRLRMESRGKFVDRGKIEALEYVLREREEIRADE